MPTKIFLASSSELLEERKEFEILVNRKNKLWQPQGAFIELIVWEDFLDAVSRTRLQDEYNKAIHDCDIFVMLFSTKVGRYTAEEFETAFTQFKATGKPHIFTYFKTAAIDLDKVVQEDLMSLWAFQKKLDHLGHFRTPYKTIDELKFEFNQQLDKLAASGFIVLKASHGDGPPPGEDSAEANSVIALYLHALATDLAGLKLGEIDASADPARQTPLQLADIYVPLDTTLQIPQDTSLVEWLPRAARRRRDEVHEQRPEQRETRTRPVSALEALAAHRQLTLLGKPGSGKSTFGANVLLALAQAWQGHPEELASLGESWTHGKLLPIRVILRRFAEQLSPGDKPARASELWDFIARDLDAAGYGMSPDTMKYVQRIARNQGALILFDGLDECGNRASRERVLAAVNELMRSTGDACRFVLCARPYAWPGVADPAQGVYALADLDDEQIERFIRAWYAALVTRGWRSPGDAERKIDDLLAARQRPDLLPLARNPLLLTLMATLHTNRGRLPDDRADLYEESVELLMLRWNRQIGADKALLDELALPSLKLSDLREVLEEVAFKVHAENVGREGTADIGEDRLIRAFCPLLGKDRNKAAVVVDYIEKRAGLLIGQGEKDGERQFTFPHRTFQEFLAASFLAAQDDFAAQCAGLARAAPTHWQVVLPLAARLAKAERGASAADELVGGKSIVEFCTRKKPNSADWSSSLLAGMQLQEIGLGAINKSPRTQAIAERVAGWLAASMPVHPDDGGAPNRQRAQAGDVLAALGDLRFDPERFHLPADEMLGFVRIAADPEFRIGTRKADAQRVAKIIGGKVPDEEINDTLTPAPEFLIARYPVTVAQFRAFVEATQYEIGAANALRDAESRPVRYVSWHEAIAYCNWLNEVIAKSPSLAGAEAAGLVRQHQWRVALPSELEWEKASRGGLRDAVFSWGDDVDPARANYDDSGIDDTSAVGCFPANAFGLYDMIGDVFEWTRSLWGAAWAKPDFGYPYHFDDGKREALDAATDIKRVVRGGSWYYARYVARCAYRFGLVPDNRSNGIGFRVVLRSSPEA
jgi:formylglycine-generating enzyme required for sulfatase activity